MLGFAVSVGGSRVTVFILGLSYGCISHAAYILPPPGGLLREGQLSVVSTAAAKPLFWLKKCPFLPETVLSTQPLLVAMGLHLRLRNVSFSTQ